ncbi:MAG: glycoside hydrolase family 2 TIM barrel-domain containing protein, partial [Chitinophagales bacterium]
ERHGFDYDNKEKIAQQLQTFRGEVEKYKDHPALLAWAVGNEVDLFYTNTNVWYAVNDIAAMIHEIDPNHPTVTVTAGYDTAETRLIIERAPHIDIYGINTYGDIGIVYDNIRTTKWDKPYIISEWGPNGHWEVQKTAWGVPVEQSSTEKAESYKQRYLQSIQRDTEKCIGSYVFLWGQKQETTSTWYGLFDETGAVSQAINELEKLWTGRTPKNSAPVMHALTLHNQVKGDTILLEANNTYFASVDVTDPDGDKLKFKWEVIFESQDIKSGGDAETKPASVKGLSMRKMGNEIRFRAPAAEGAYRLFFYAYDGQGNYAYQNIPFYVLPAVGDANYRFVEMKKQSL